MVFLKEFFEKVDFEKKSADGKKNMQNYPEGKEFVRELIMKQYISITISVTRIEMELVLLQDFDG